MTMSPIMLHARYDSVHSRDAVRRMLCSEEWRERVPGNGCSSFTFDFGKHIRHLNERRLVPKSDAIHVDLRCISLHTFSDSKCTAPGEVSAL